MWFDYILDLIYRGSAPMPVTPRFYGLNTVVVRVRDRGTVAWYKASLGLQVVFEDAAAGMIVFNVGHGDSLIVSIVRDEDAAEGADHGSCPIFEVNDAAGYRRDLASRSIRVTDLKEGRAHLCVAFWDPEGNRLEGWQLIEPSREVGQ
jgi:catechol 2,3-dioxygenase-like lactoylglutathione lyase family enzyme